MKIVINPGGVNVAVLHLLLESKDRDAEQLPSSLGFKMK